MMKYIGGEYSYILKYSELKEQYIKHVNMSDEEFLKNLPSALHTACIICFLKEIPTYVCLIDEGIIHELTHLLHIPEDCEKDLKRIRKLFKKQLKLA